MSAREVMLHLIITFDDFTEPHLIVPDALALASGLLLCEVQMKC